MLRALRLQLRLPPQPRQLGPLRRRLKIQSIGSCFRFRFQQRPLLTISIPGIHNNTHSPRSLLVVSVPVPAHRTIEVAAVEPRSLVRRKPNLHKLSCTTRTTSKPKQPYALICSPADCLWLFHERKRAWWSVDLYLPRADELKCPKQPPITPQNPPQQFIAALVELCRQLFCPGCHSKRSPKPNFLRITT